MVSVNFDLRPTQKIQLCKGPSNKLLMYCLDSIRFLVVFEKKKKNFQCCPMVVALLDLPQQKQNMLSRIVQDIGLVDVEFLNGNKSFICKMLKTTKVKNLSNLAPIGEMACEKRLKFEMKS